MIKDKVFSAKITTYRNYLVRSGICRQPMDVIKRIELLSLLKKYYKNNGAFIYEVNKYEL